ncbi:MAG: cytidylate kinase family protein [Phycisphaerae bacterium]|jgi:hypothetical protein
MAPISVADYIRDLDRKEVHPRGQGPFITISRQYGCYGFSVASRLAELLNEGRHHGPAVWKAYGTETLSELAEQTHVPLKVLERQRRSEPTYINELFRLLYHESTPSCWEIRRRITTIIRGLALGGHAIIVGHGGSCATADLAHGLSVRTEAPQDWRIRQVAMYQRIGLAHAARLIRQGEAERQFLRGIYAIRFPRSPAFNIVYDCSVFSVEEIARHVASLMHIRQLA